MKYRLILSFFLLATFTIVSACKEDEPPIPDTIIQFPGNNAEFSDTQDELTVTLRLTRPLESAATITIGLEPAGITYGEEFITQPEAAANSISLNLPAGATEGTFRIIKKAGVFLSGSESIKLSLKGVPSPLLTGTISTATVKFSSIVSTGTELILNGIAGTEAGASARNSVYVDFSNNRTTPVLRSAWDFGFYCGAEFRVILNNTTGATARVLDKTDLKAVVAADTVPSSAWTLSGARPEEMSLIDDVSGDLSNTVIAEVAANDNDNKVYIVNRGTSGSTPARAWLKIRILRKGSDGYTLEYAAINDTEFKTLDVTKDARYNFVYVFTDPRTAAKAEAEPQKNNWDIKWGYQISHTTLSPGLVVPTPTPDFVAINHLGGVEAAEVRTSSVSYESFSEQHLTSIEFSRNYDVIGTNWRTVSATAGGSGVNKDRFYVVKDTVGNIYKLRFLSFHPDEGGTRGKPLLEYKLVVKKS